MKPESDGVKRCFLEAVGTAPAAVIFRCGRCRIREAPKVSVLRLFFGQIIFDFDSIFLDFESLFICYRHV